MRVMDTVKETIADVSNVRSDEGLETSAVVAFTLFITLIATRKENPRPL